MVKIEWSELAKDDLKEIYTYISQDASQYADYFLERIYEYIENLELFPRMGRLVPESDDPGDRELIFQNYRIVYHFSEERVEIITIIHGSRLLKL